MLSADGLHIGNIFYYRQENIPIPSLFFEIPNLPHQTEFRYDKRSICHPNIQILPDLLTHPLHFVITHI